MHKKGYGQKKEAERWGLHIHEIGKLGNRLTEFYKRFQIYLRTQTRDTSEYGRDYMSGLLRMETGRNITNVGRKTEVPGQNLQHFISNSTWSGPGLIEAVQKEIKVHPAFEKAILVLDESAEEKNGGESVGAYRQHNGRLGKVEMSQVGVFLSLVTPQVNLWIDGELYLPNRWFDADYASQREKVGLPKELTFKTKPEIGWEMIQKARKTGIPFEAVVMDDLYGRNKELRQQLDQAGIEYYGDVPVVTQVYLERPEIIYPVTKNGKTAIIPQIKGTVYEVRDLRQRLEWKMIQLRPNERGHLKADFARCRVWVVYGNEVHPEWLLVRKDPGQITYVLSNAPEDISLETMAWRKTHRYLIERSNQDAKSEIGWDEFQARKYRAWQHHLALTILSTWFIAETRLDWMQRFKQDPNLLITYEVDILPDLSVANVRELLRAALPLPQLSVEEATQLVTSHLVNRTRSRKSHMAKAKKKELGCRINV